VHGRNGVFSGAIMKHSPNQNPTDPISEEDAFNFIVQCLKQSPDGGDQTYGYGLYLTRVMERFMHEVRNSKEDIRRFYKELSEPFMSAAWTLCRRGIIRPGVREFGAQDTGEGSAGGGYSLTPFGRMWLKEAGNKYEYVPTEPGRFAQLLERIAPRFGDGFKQRAQEAVRCYGAHAYLACCAMCGAAAESVYLAIAIQKIGDKEQAEKEYLSGRGRIEAKLVGNLPDQLKTEFRGYTTLLKYWRDATAHGMASEIDDAQAFTSLAYLLRFAQFASDRWDELTQKP
jgi:hypothetical protein